MDPGLEFAPEPELKPELGVGEGPGVVVTKGVPEGETVEDTVESCPAAEHVLEYADKAA